MLLTIPYLLIGRGAIALIDAGAPEWLYLVFMLCLVKAIKFFMWGPISLVMLGQARLREARALKQMAEEPVIDECGTEYASIRR
ncbi:MAG: hypothetical protein LCH36_02690 [Actinobacteria bacterium]|nr:hypothetical protein [Actinomycetota bacterium]